MRPGNSELVLGSACRWRGQCFNCQTLHAEKSWSASVPAVGDRKVLGLQAGHTSSGLHCLKDSPQQLSL